MNTEHIIEELDTLPLSELRVNSVARLDRGRQTGGPWKVVSDSAVLDFQLE